MTWSLRNSQHAWKSLNNLHWNFLFCFKRMRTANNNEKVKRTSLLFSRAFRHFHVVMWNTLTINLYGWISIAHFWYTGHFWTRLKAGSWSNGIIQHTRPMIMMPQGRSTVTAGLDLQNYHLELDIEHTLILRDRRLRNLVWKNIPPPYVHINFSNMQRSAQRPL